MSQEIERLFSSIAPKYDLLNTVLSLGIDRTWRRRGVQHLKDCKNVLDLCAGTLALSQELLQINPGAKITAVDFSQEMLDRGIAKLRNRAVTTYCADFFQLDLPVETFDGVMCSYGMRNLDNNPAALKKIHDLLKPGGRFVILEFFRPDRWYTWAYHLTYAQFILPTIGRLISSHDGAYKHLRDSVRRFYTIDQYVGLLRETGFEVKAAKRLTGGISGLIVADKI